MFDLDKTTHNEQLKPEKKRELVATEDALWSLYEINKNSLGSIEEILNQLALNNTKSNAVRISGSSSPLWQVELPEDSYLYYTIEANEEVRIVYAGHKLDETSLAYLVRKSQEMSDIVFDSPSNKQALPSINKLNPDSAKHKSFDSYHPPPTSNVSPKLPSNFFGQKYRRLSNYDLGSSVINVGPPDDLPLKLGPKQQELLDAPYPLLLQGVAGSGKTTIIVHSAMRRLLESNLTAKILIVVYQPALKHYVDSVLRSFFDDNNEIMNVEIFTYRELCDSIAESAGNEKFSWIDSDQIVEILRVLRKEAGFSTSISIPELIDEVRSALKGKSLDINSPIVDKNTYLSGDYETLHISEGMKEGIYAIAENYQVYITDRQFTDDMGAAQVLLQQGFENLLGLWDFVFIDEVQDYTLNQIVLLAKMCKNTTNIMFTGDEFQIVQASQFSWARVKEALGEIGQNSHNFEYININYRNTKAILNFGNSILKHRQDRLKMDIPEPALSNQPLTPLPIRAKLNRKELAEVIENLASEIPSLGVIYLTENEVEDNICKLRGIEFRRGFTPKTVKGLEFEAVCLVEFGSKFSSLLPSKGRSSSASEMFLFNQLYVAASRPRKMLILLDVQSAHEQIWDMPCYEEQYAIAEDREKLVEEVMLQSFTSDEKGWRLTALDFERQNVYAAAAECWERSGDWKRAAKCLKDIEDWKAALLLYTQNQDFEAAANLCEQLDKPIDAAKHWVKAKVWDKAARNWMACKNYKEAVSAWKKTSFKKELFHAEALLYENEKQYLKASLSWEKTDNMLAAAESAERGLDLTRAIKLWKNLGDEFSVRRVSATLAESKGDYELAAKNWKLIKDWHRAAINLEKSQKFGEAIKLWERSKDLMSLDLARSMEMEANGNKRGAASIQRDTALQIWQIYEGKASTARIHEKEAKRMIKNAQRQRAVIGGGGRRKNQRGRTPQAMDYSHHIRSAFDLWKLAANYLQESLIKYTARDIDGNYLDKWRFEIETVGDKLSGLNIKSSRTKRDVL